MKLFEDLAEMGGTIRDAVQKIIKDVYKQEPDDSKLDEIVSSLSLSDLLELDRAYTAKDAEKIKAVIGPMPQMEYSMGGGRQATSQASNRPAPNQPQGQKAKVEPGTQNTVQTNRNYSSGAQNAVTTKKVDVNDPNAQIDPTKEEPVEEEAPVDDAPARPTDQHEDQGQEQDTASVSDVSFYSDEQPTIETAEEEGRPTEDINVVDMVKWLKRRAGNDK